MRRIISRGSSPPARGTLDRDNRKSKKATQAGLIPACAGNTSLGIQHLLRNRAHPRLRGEHLLTVPHVIDSQGSSPPARGTRQRIRAAGAGQGLIPACAGNTIFRMQSRRSPPAHPRLRGEHGVDGQLFNAGSGSSPPARGTHTVRRLAGARRGLIPACAGNTQSRPASNGWERAHPRLRGEHLDRNR